MFLGLDVGTSSVKAVVVLREGHRTSESDVIQHCKHLLADFKKPRSVDFVPELPRNPNGKLARKLVREPYWAGQARRVG